MNISQTLEINLGLPICGTNHQMETIFSKNQFGMHRDNAIKFPHNLIWGAGGHALSISNVLIEKGLSDYSFINKDGAGSSLSPVLYEKEIQSSISGNIFLGIGDNQIRAKVFEGLKSQFKDSTFPSLVSKSAIIATDVTIGEGTIIFPGAIVNAGAKIGKGCVINCGAIIEHGCLLDDFSFVASGSVLGGDVSLGKRTHLGLNTTVNPGSVVGENVLIGSGSVVTKNLEPNSLYLGVPATKIRDRKENESFLS